MYGDYDGNRYKPHFNALCKLSLTVLVNQPFDMVRIMKFHHVVYNSSYIV